MFEQIVAGLVLMGILAAWLGAALGPARRQRLRLAWFRVRAWPRRRRQRMSNRRDAERTAEREADRVIERLRNRPKVDRSGNVYRPDAFDRRERDDKDPLH